MLDVGWTEILVIAVILIIVVGPKDLPAMLRTFGQMVSKMRGMAGEFRQQFDEAIREADLEDVKKTIGDAQKLNPLNSIREAVNPLRKVGDDIKRDLTKATSSVSSNGNPTVGVVPVAEPVVTEAVPEVPAAVAAQSGKPASSEPVAAEPLKKGPTTKGSSAAKTTAAKATAAKTASESKAKAPRKSAAKAETAKASAARTTTAKKPAARKTKKDQA